MRGVVRGHQAGRAVWVLARAGARLAGPVTPRPREEVFEVGPVALEL